MHMYCLFCQTQRAEQIAELIEYIHNGDDGFRCISPKIVQRYWVKGREERRIHNYLPGYIFLYMEEPLPAEARQQTVPGIIRMLGLPEDNYELTGPDRDFAQMLYDMDGTIGIMKTIREGDLVKLDRSLYKGFTGEVIKIDRRKGRAQIRFTFDGSVQLVWVGYEMVRPVKGEGEKQDTNNELKNEDNTDANVGTTNADTV